MSPPDADAERVRASRAARLLDGIPDPRLDAFARLASHLLDVPIAAVSLIDADRQVFQSAVGGLGGEMPREMSFCTHAVAQPEVPMVVEDLRADPRFRDNPMVVGDLHARAYAGLAVRDAEGRALGTLCVVAREPRRFTEADLAALADLRAGVEAVLLLRESLHLLRQATLRDRVTGLPSAGLFHLRLAEEEVGWGAPAPAGDVGCGLIRLRLNRPVPAGGGVEDVLLRGAAERITAALRPADLATRLSGDNFAVLLPGPLARGQAEAIAGRVLEAFASPILADGEPVRLRPSLGLAVAPRDGPDAAGLLHCAEVAMRALRGWNAGYWAGHTAKVEAAAAERRAMREDLGLAARAGQFRLQWQPIIEVATGRLHAREALLRWHRPGHGVVSPATFMPLAESAALVTVIDPWVLRAACRQALDWPGGVIASVNVSARWFEVSGERLAEHVAAALAGSGLPPSRLRLEITERVLIADEARALRDINRVRELGVGMVLDDFGTGYSSLSVLEAFPFDAVKLDRAFIRGLLDNPRSQVVARMAIALGRELGMQVCAEGVEEDAQLDFLRAENCELAQGYLLGRPAPLPDTSTADEGPGVAPGD